MKVGLTIVKDNLRGLASAVDRLVGQRVMVGVPSPEALRRPEPGQKSGPITNAALAYIHETGAPVAGIPARPFLKPGIEENRAVLEDGLAVVAQAALDGDKAKADRGLHAVGLRAQAFVLAKITSGPFLPLKPATLAARRRRGRMGTKPLIDTAQLRNSISYVVRRV